MGEAINLVNNFKVEKVIFNYGPYNDLEQELIKILGKKKIKYYSCIKELNINKNKLYFLQTKVYDNENDNSNVLYTELDGYKFMFMGDASITTEKEILKKYNLPDIDVLKVGHHRSKTSSGKEFNYDYHYEPNDLIDIFKERISRQLYDLNHEQYIDSSYISICSAFPDLKSRLDVLYDDYKNSLE